MSSRYSTAKRRAISWAILFPGGVFTVWAAAALGAGQTLEVFVLGALLSAWLAAGLLILKWPPRPVAHLFDGLPGLSHPRWSRLIAPLVLPAFFLFAAWAGLKHPDRPLWAPFGIAAYVVFAAATWLGGQAVLRWSDRSMERRGVFSVIEIRWAEVASVRAVSMSTFLVTSTSGEHVHVSLTADGAPEFARDALRLLPRAVLDAAPGVETILRSC